MAVSVIRNFIAKQLFKQKGAIANNKSVDFSANALENRLKNLGFDIMSKGTEPFGGVGVLKEILRVNRANGGPVPGSEVTMNAADLLADAREEKVFLVEDLKATMQTASLTNQLELAATQTKFINDAMQGVPMHVYVG